MPWESVAGSAFQQRIDDLSSDRLRCIGEFRDAAAALRGHAAACRARIEEIKRLERLAEEALRAAAHAAEGAANAAEHAAASVVNTGKRALNGAVDAIGSLF